MKLLFIILAAFPLVKNGQCPAGYFQSGNYCAPMDANSNAQAIPKVGQCPSGYATSGNYCLRMKK